MKRLFLIRHAHRDTSDRILDNGLSEKGKLQAEALKAHFKKLCEKTGGPLRFVSSPKLRCVETLTPLAAEFNFVIEIDDRLDEGNFDEDGSAFVKRIAGFLEEMSQNEKNKSLVFICSHGDWIPEALRMVTGNEINLKKAGFVELGYGQKKLDLVEVTQSLS